MRIAFVTPFDAKNVRRWSGTPYFMVKAFEKLPDVKLDFIGPLHKQPLPMTTQVKRVIKKILFNKKYSHRYHPDTLYSYADQINAYLKNHEVDVILSPLLEPVAFLQCKQPIIIWCDAVLAGMQSFYPGYNRLCQESLANGHAMTNACLSNSRLAIFSSQWAADTAVQYYKADKNKIKVVPFGANIDLPPAKSVIQESINNKLAFAPIKLLFLGVEWERKGGDIALQVAIELHKKNLPVELIIIGTHPPKRITLPSYIKCLGFISKHTAEGRQLLESLFLQTHFLLVPSRAEAFGIVFAEAGAYGVPCLTSNVGGIPEIIKDDLNGMTFSLDTPPIQLADYIATVTQNKSHYQQLAMNALHEYENRLNWQTATTQVKQLIENSLL